MTPVHILLVEDNEGDILLTTEAFEEWAIPCSISVVKDGSDAIDFLSRKGKYEGIELPDLVLLDINLPKKNGQEVLRFIKAHDVLRKIPVIMLTTSSAQKDMDESARNKANAFMSKPLQTDAFADIISTLKSSGRFK